jgi:1,6-anhydro-N-acetylmuramate kinase
MATALNLATLQAQATALAAGKLNVVTVARVTKPNMPCDTLVVSGGGVSYELDLGAFHYDAAGNAVLDADAAAIAATNHVTAFAPLAAAFAKGKGA